MSHYSKRLFQMNKSYGKKKIQRHVPPSPAKSQHQLNLVNLLTNPPTTPANEQHFRAYTPTTRLKTPTPAGALIKLHPTHPSPKNIVKKKIRKSGRGTRQSLHRPRRARKEIGLENSLISPLDYTLGIRATRTRTPGLIYDEAAIQTRNPGRRCGSFLARRNSRLPVRRRYIAPRHSSGCCGHFHGSIDAPAAADDESQLSRVLDPRRRCTTRKQARRARG